MKRSKTAVSLDRDKREGREVSSTDVTSDKAVERVEMGKGSEDAPRGR